MNKWIIAVVCIVTIVLLAGCTAGAVIPLKDKTLSRAIVGEDITAGQIKEFYYTIATATCPAFYQRYYLYVDGDRYMFFHETREGEAWPLTEEYSTRSGTVELTRQQWEAFIAALSEGEVTERNEDAASGGAGPSLFLYWDGDGEICQKFSFESDEKSTEFENLCQQIVQGGPGND